MKPYSHSTWVVKPGHEDEFLRLWQELADWTVTENFAQSAMLLRDADRPNTFVSFGPWHTVEEIERWRRTHGFAERVERLRDVLESWEPRTLQLVFEAS
jgi:quinol monooxygenase YgiN